MMSTVLTVVITFTLALNDIQSLFPGTCGHVTLCWKKAFVDVIKLRPLRYRGCSGLAGWAQCLPWSPPGLRWWLRQ